MVVRELVSPRQERACGPPGLRPPFVQPQAKNDFHIFKGSYKENDNEMYGTVTENIYHLYLYRKGLVTLNNIKSQWKTGYLA